MRCWRRADAPLAKAALDASLEHLQAWMAWARDEPSPVERIADRLERFAGLFERGESWPVGLFDPDETEVLGGMGVRPDVGEGGLQMGYWIRADRTGQGLVTEAAAAMTRLGFEHLRARFIEVHCDPANEPSSGVARRLGFVPTVVVPQRILGPDGEPRDTAIWRMLAADWSGSPAAEMTGERAVRMYDEAGAEVPASG